MARPESSIANCDAAMAYWMKTSIFLTSFLSMNCRACYPLTSAALCAADPLTSNLVIRATPLVPASSAFQFSLVPMPTDDTRPMPVMTTRLLKTVDPAAPRRPEGLQLPLLPLRVRVDVVDRFLHARNLLGVLVRDLNPKLLLERHDELHRVERVRADRKSTRLNSSHSQISYAVFCLKKKNRTGVEVFRVVQDQLAQ